MKMKLEEKMIFACAFAVQDHIKKYLKGDVYFPEDKIKQLHKAKRCLIEVMEEYDKKNGKVLFSDIELKLIRNKISEQYDKINEYNAKFVEVTEFDDKMLTAVNLSLGVLEDNKDNIRLSYSVRSNIKKAVNIINKFLEFTIQEAS